MGGAPLTSNSHPRRVAADEFSENSSGLLALFIHTSLKLPIIHLISGGREGGRD